MVTTALNRVSLSKLACHSASRQAQNQKPKVRRLPQLGPNYRVQATAYSARSCLAPAARRA
jgi:hypothetical protein